MSAIPLALNADTPDQAPQGPVGFFWQRLDALESRYQRLWLEAEDSPPQIGCRHSWWARRTNARHCRRLIENLARRIESYPERSLERREWRREVKEEVRQFGEGHLGWPEEYRKLLVADEFYQATVRFCRRARRFDPAMNLEDVGQALRNVWIVNSLQMMLDFEIVLTPAVFAYSMLYPITDNYLDDPGVSLDSKEAFNHLLGQSLEGFEGRALDGRQRDVLHLLSLVEAQFPRAHHPEVFASLLAIHRGQIESLEQQAATALVNQSEVLKISVRKGGASVLADGYLAAGRLSPGEEDFCFGYGVFLQLLDDLQDIEHDLEAGHRTLFTLAATSGSLDRITKKLFWFMNRVVNGSERFAAPRYRAHRDLILRNCVGLMVSAVAEHPKFFSLRFRRHLERQWTMSLGAMRRLRRRSAKRLRAAGDALGRTQEVGSFLELL